ncbi:hypothetical protein [Roseomonas sp. 18066]|uniref:hypothetical protein n=1 Tax=Roseomonas sp. 18066 TaxID=2681412 RepID=UPI0013570AE4|nr:hypothetical protein [Roseomonas sp. 18066]
MLKLLPEQDIVLFQSADPVNYFSMLRSTAKLNRAFCMRHDIRYTCFHGIMRGFHAWHACYNRILLLNDMLDLGFTGWYLHLDSDAYVFDPRYDIRAYLKTSEENSFVFTHGATKALWDVNDGVFFANCAHPDTQTIARAWLAKLETVKLEKLRKAEKWYDTPGDQQLLQSVLKSDEALTAAIRHEHPRFINGPGSSFIRQILRSTERDPAARLERIELDVERAMGRQKLDSDDRVLLYCALMRHLGLPVPKEIETVREATADRAALLDFLEKTVAEVRASMAAEPPPPAEKPPAQG